MNLNEAKTLADELLHKHNLSDWRFRFDYASRRFGCCRYSIKTISVSEQLTLLNTLDEFKSTVLHEIAHALVGPGHGHDNVWKSKAIELGDTGERCYSVNVITPPTRWIASCPICGWTRTKSRRLSNPVCRHCGTRVVYTQNKNYTDIQKSINSNETHFKKSYQVGDIYQG